MSAEPTTFNPVAVSTEFAMRWFRRRIGASKHENSLDGFDISPAPTTRLLIL